MKKIVSILMVAVLTLSTSTVAFAAETDESVNTNKSAVEEKMAQLMTKENMREIEVELTEEDLRLLSKEECIEAGFSEEEIEGRNIYEVNTEYPGTIPSILYSGDIGYEDITASTTFTGAGHTIYANYLKLGVSVKSGKGNLIIGLYSYNSLWPHSGVRYDKNNYGYTWTSDWIDIYSGDTYYLKYWLSTVSDFSTDMPITFRVIMAAV